MIDYYSISLYVDLLRNLHYNPFYKQFMKSYGH